MFIEIIATTLDQAVQAKKFGADRIELVTGMLESGLTPSLGLIKEIKEKVNIPMAVMIRPHSKSFIYSENDLETMITDIKLIEPLGIDNFVLGVLDENNNINEESLKYLLSNIKNTPVVFHKAFDYVSDYKKSIDILKKYPQIDRILTSFGSKNFKDDILKVKEYLNYAKSVNMNILLGGGINKDNIKHLISDLHVKQIHVGSLARINGNPIMDLDENSVNQIMELSGKYNY